MGDVQSARSSDDISVNGSEQNGILNQDGGSCYAAAIAKAVIDAESRIVGRISPGCHGKAMQALYTELTLRHGKNGACVPWVLPEATTPRQLRFWLVSQAQAIENVRNGRTQIATFSLTRYRWKIFEEFYRKNRHGILGQNLAPKRDAAMAKTLSAAAAAVVAGPHVVLAAGMLARETWHFFGKIEGGGHAVCLTRYEYSEEFNDYYAVFQNSWGENWADHGEFKVNLEGMAVFDLKPTYYDVYFYESDLTEADKAAWKALYG